MMYFRENLKKLRMFFGPDPMFMAVKLSVELSNEPKALKFNQ